MLESVVYQMMKDIKAFENKIWLSSPTMHGEELMYVTKAYNTNWMSTVGANINEVERLTCEKVGCSRRKSALRNSSKQTTDSRSKGSRLFHKPLRLIRSLMLDKLHKEVGQKKKGYKLKKL